MKTLLPLLLLPLVACGGDDPAPADDPAADAGATTDPAAPHPLADRVLAEAPEGAVEVSQLRSLEDGARVTVRGDVRDPAPVDGRAVLVLYDHGLVSCDEMGDDDHCETPWDFCCEDPDKIAMGSTMVEFRADGRVVAASLAGFEGMDYLTDVVVTGTLRLDEAGNARVEADGIHVE